MESTRRDLMKLAGSVLAVEAGLGLVGASAVSAQERAGGKRKILAFSGSRRLGKTTATGLKIVFDGIREKDATIETELIELANYRLFCYGINGADVPEDDFPKLVEKIKSPEVAGFVFGTPSYFGCVSALMKTFFEKFTLFAKDATLKNKIVGAIAVGGNRNGGQERCLEQIWTALSSRQVIFAQDAPPTAHWGGTLWNQNDSLDDDEFGRNTAKNVGIRIAELLNLVRPTA